MKIIILYMGCFFFILLSNACGIKVVNTSYIYFDKKGNLSAFSFKKDSFEFIDFDGRKVVGIYKIDTKGELLLTENMYINNKADMTVTEKFDTTLADSIEFIIDVNGQNNLAHCFIYFIGKQSETIWRFCSPRVCINKNSKDSISKGFYFVFPYNLSSNIYYPNYDQSNSFLIKFNIPKNRFSDTYFNNEKMILKWNYLQFNYKGIMATPFDKERLRRMKYRKVK